MTITNKRILVVLISASLLLFLYLLLSVVKGYCPTPVVIRKLYYNWKLERDGSGVVHLIDEQFKFHQKGYFTEKEIESSDLLPHYLVLTASEPNVPLPLDYIYKGSLCIKIYRKEKQIYTDVTSGAINAYRYGKNGRPSQLYYFRIAEIPFPLRGKAYKDIKVQITVLEPDTELLKYTDSAVLSLVPDLRL